MISKLPLKALRLLLLLCLPLLACGEDDDGEAGANGDGGVASNGGGSGALGEGPCERASDCAGDVCVALIDGDHPPVYCSQPCGSGCPDGFVCDTQTFGMVGLEFCRFGDDPSAEPPAPAEPPRLPCTSDADCEGELVCATYEGERDCTLPCAQEPECTFNLAGIEIDVATCAADQTAGQDRTVCLPDPACYPNITSCIGGFPGGGLGI